MKHTFTYGTYSYEYYVEYRERKTLGLVVRPDLRIIVSVPYDTPHDEVEAFLIKKWRWLDKHLAELRRYHKKTYEQQYVSGASVDYLGRQYLLLVEPAIRDAVTLQRGKLLVSTTRRPRDSAYNKQLVDEWYERNRERVFKRIYLLALKKFDYGKMPQLKFRAMQRRWGSCSSSGKIITLNPRLIEAPVEAIMYVVVHELCHVGNKNHDIKFYEQLEKRVPRWREIKDRLEVRYG